MVIAVVSNPIPPDSSIVTHVGRARWYGETRRGFSPRLGVVHTTESPNASVSSSLSYSSRRPDAVSTTVFAGEEGIGQDTREQWRPYTQARWNDEALALETIGAAAWSEDQWRSTRSRTIANVEAVLRDWRARYSLPPRWLTPEEVLAGAPGFCDHLICNQAAILEDPSRAGRNPYTHTDCGAGLRAIVRPILDRIAAETSEEEPVYRILILTDAGGAAVLMYGFTARWLDPARYNEYHYFYPYIVDEPASTAWLRNLTFLGPLPPGVTPGHVWGHQPDA